MPATKESYRAGYITQAGKMVANIFVRLQVTFKFHMAKAAGYPYVFLGACFHLGSKADSSYLMDNETYYRLRWMKRSYSLNLK